MICIDSCDLVSFSLLNVFPGGAGGKGVWGTPGQVYDLEEVDIKDPNYDDDQVKKCLVWCTSCPQCKILRSGFPAFLLSPSPLVCALRLHPHMPSVHPLLCWPLPFIRPLPFRFLLSVACLVPCALAPAQ